VAPRDELDQPPAPAEAEGGVTVKVHPVLLR
jgi:hypothetical protein